MAAHAHDQLWAAGVAAHAPPHLRDYYLGYAGRDYLGGQYPGSRTLNPNGAGCETRRQAILAPGDTANAKEVRGDGHQAPWNNGQDKGMAYPRWKIHKALSGYRGNNPWRTREVPDRRAPHRSRSSSSPRWGCRRRGSSCPRSITSCRGGGSCPRPSKGLLFWLCWQELLWGSVPRQCTLNGASYKMRRQAIFTPGDMTNAKEDRGDGQLIRWQSWHPQTH